MRTCVDALLRSALVPKVGLVINKEFAVRGFGKITAAADAVEDLAFVSQLKRDLPKYLAAARGFTCNHGDVGEFTEAVLGWWKNHAAEVGAWAVGAQIIFSLTPNSAAAERIFSQMKHMFGANQATALADMLQSSMMLRYHKRLAPKVD